METGLTEDALLGGRVRLLQPRHGYRVAIDSVLLAACVDARPGERVLDLGAGVGAVGLCVAARVGGCSVTGIELQPALAALAARNVDLNDMAGRVRTIVHDVAEPLPRDLGLFDHVATNPPYLAAAVADPSPDRVKALATVESSASLLRWLEAATAALAPDGTLAMVHRIDRLEEIVGLLGRLDWADVTLKRLSPVPRALFRARRARSASRRESTPLQVHLPDGGYSVEAEAILRHGASLAF
jgi:tRNA1(Val) A37 N6-methylase TrmN6